jgi:hypothetical protein
MQGALFYLYQSLYYVDDCAFIFTNSQEFERGTKLIYSQMRRFGLLVHIRSDGKKSKIEAIYFPLQQEEQRQNKKHPISLSTQHIMDM